VKVTEAMEREDELKRLREENAELKKKLADLPTLESSKKKLDLKVEQLEKKVRPQLLLVQFIFLSVNRWRT